VIERILAARAELGLELYPVDLSQITSKWVGETEKQLGRVFDAAEHGHALLLFDEADSLFGQRSQDVQGATDRLANMEVNFFFQRVEAFNGITILTTNLDSAIDSALKRRLAAHIVFELPDDDDRAVLWRLMLSTGASPLAIDLDFDALSRTFGKMSGANIRNAALAAAFMAAGESEPEIRQEHVLRAARTEYRSMGHVLSDRR
jgi:SpoVK/Ycf46/Vps4 family AAA+-type ATPase